MTNNGELKFDLQLPADQEVGVFADFANVWHNPATFVIDFLSVRGPVFSEGPDSQPTLSAKVASRIRIAPEQIFPLIEALKTQSAIWLQESGKTEPPESWLAKRTEGD